MNLLLRRRALMRNKAIDDELPIGYKRLLDISYDGNFYYNTAQYLYGYDIVTLTVTPNGTTGQNVFGAYSGTGSDAWNFSLYIYGSTTSNSYVRYGQALIRPNFGTTKRTVSFGAGGTSGFRTDATTEESEFTSTDEALIGALPNSSSPKFGGVLSGNIEVGTRLKYIPCKRLTDNTIGYYELHNRVFLEPIGTGTPTTSGYDTSHEHY